MGKPKVYDGENYLSYPVKYEQGELFVEKTSDIQIFIFNISKIGDKQPIGIKTNIFNFPYFQHIYLSLFSEFHYTYTLFVYHNQKVSLGLTSCLPS